MFACASRAFRHNRPRPVKVRIGAFELHKTGARRFDFRDPYHAALGASWPLFIAGVIASHIGINLLFALLYWLRPGSFADAFFFSVETVATVGYGEMAPATLYGHIVAAVEIFCGMAFLAIVTGLLFVRFSRPKARILYAEKAVIARRHGAPTLMVRIGNGRISLLTDARAHLHAMLAETSPEGQFFRRSFELALVRERIPIFALTWTLMHEIRESSPLYGYGPERLAQEDVRLFVTVDAWDQVLAANVHDIKDYGHADILFGMRYADAVSQDAQRRTLADLTLISELEPDVLPG